MNLGALLSAFVHDDQFVIAIILIFLDVVLGSLAAAKHGNFRFSYFGDFARNDLLYKLVPWFVLYAASKVAGGVDIVIPGLDLGVVSMAIFVALVAAWVASILGSLQELGLPSAAPQTLKTALFASENAAPPKD